MEFILFRLIQLMKRELLILDELQTCFNRPQACFAPKNVTGNGMGTQQPDRLVLEIQQLEFDKKEECLLIAKKLKLSLVDWSLYSLLKKVNAVMDHSNFLLVSLYQDLLALLKTAKTKNASLQKYLHDLSFTTAPHKISVNSNENETNLPASSSNIPSPIPVKKMVRINMN